ncbi:hypothetical protein AAE02nite_41110 [Adhaeribacter aerolatus]|uniref:Uncharacterized protein n=1 Tax=Adhaeribacter aerolatus TaxID=670289 RepID=A0A512B3S8_9BACT|nr:SxtJ family membrane protein [Adhaeribacter aerolatus]GEO06447.1 hypothetical protein AAE02nite_41110 [Adhaeribacter aerolatus]
MNNIPIAREKKLETVLVLVVGLLVFHVLFKHEGFLLAAQIMGALCILSEHVLTLITWTWLKLTLALGFIGSILLLTLLFFLVICPIAFVYRLKNKDPLQLKKNPSGSYFTVRNHTYNAKDLEKMW